MKLWIVGMVVLLLLPLVVAQQKTACVDSEEGVDEFVKGTVTWLESYDDFCKDETRLQDYFCNEQGEMEKKFIDCEEGCLDGVCLGKKAEPQVVEVEPEALPPAAVPPAPEAPSSPAGGMSNAVYWILGLIVVGALAWYAWKKKK